MRLHRIKSCVSFPCTCTTFSQHFGNNTGVVQRCRSLVWGCLVGVQVLVQLGQADRQIPVSEVVPEGDRVTCEGPAKSAHGVGAIPTQPSKQQLQQAQPGWLHCLKHSSTNAPDVPAQWPKLAPVLHDSMEQTQAEQQAPPGHGLAAGSQIRLGKPASKTCTVTVSVTTLLQSTPGLAGSSPATGCDLSRQAGANLVG